MEYEIGDDPQGLPEQLDGDRDGGVRVNAHTRRTPRFERRPRTDRHAPFEQMGEIA